MDKVTRLLRVHPQFAAGRADAESEIASGLLGYRIHGKLDSSNCDESRTILHDRLGICLQLNGNCLVDSDDAARAAGYNDRMLGEIVHRFGEDVIASVIREVERKQKKGRNTNTP